MCEFIKEDGEQCGAYAVANSNYCVSHDPTMREVKLDAVKKGGSSENYRKLDLELSPLTIKNSSDVVTATVQTINELRAGTLPPKIANTIGYLLGIALKAFEQSDLTNKLEVIERVILERSTK